MLENEIRSLIRFPLSNTSYLFLYNRSLNTRPVDSWRRKEAGQVGGERIHGLRPPRDTGSRGARGRRGTQIVPDSQKPTLVATQRHCVSERINYH